MKRTFFNKASDSTTSQNLLSSGAIVNESGMAINNNTKTMAAMFTQVNSTNAIMLIAFVGIAAYMIYLYNKKK